MSKYSIIRKRKGLSCRDFAKSMRDIFPAINAAAVSLAERSCESGVQYTPCARKIIGERFGGTTALARQGRKDNESIHVWVSKCIKDAFASVKQHYGFSTDHDTLIFLVNNENKRIKEAAHSDGADMDGKTKYIDNNFNI